MEHNIDKSLRAPQDEPNNSFAQAGDLRREKEKSKKGETPTEFSFPKHTKPEGAGSTETPPLEPQRTPKQSRLVQLWEAAASAHRKKAQETGGASMAEGGRPGYRLVSVSTLRYKGPETTGVWAPRPEESFDHNAAGVKGLDEEELGSELARAREGIVAARRANPAGNPVAEMTKEEASIMETFYFPETLFLPFAPHVVARFVLSRFSRKLRNALIAYYREQPYQLNTAFRIKEEQFISPTPKTPVVARPVVQVAEPAGETLTESQLPIAEWTRTEQVEPPQGEEQQLETPAEQAEGDGKGPAEQQAAAEKEAAARGELETEFGEAAGLGELGTASPMLGVQAQPSEQGTGGKEPSPELEYLGETMGAKTQSGFPPRPAPLPKVSSPVGRSGPSAVASGAGPPAATLGAGPSAQLPPASLQTLGSMILTWKGYSNHDMEDTLPQLWESFAPPAPPKPEIPEVVSSTLEWMTESVPGLTQSEPGGSHTCRISKGNPMPGSSGILPQAARQLDWMTRRNPVGMTTGRQNLYSCLTKDAFERIAAQIVQGPQPVEGFNTLDDLADRFMFQTEPDAEALERNDFSLGFLLRHGGKGRNNTMISGMLRPKEAATSFWNSSDRIFEKLAGRGGQGDKEPAFPGTASTSQTKQYHVIPHFFEVDLILEFPPPLSAGGKKVKPYRFEIPQHASVKLATLRPGDPIFLLDAETDDLMGTWFMTTVDLPPRKDGVQVTSDLLKTVVDPDALAAYYSVDPAAPSPREGWTRWAYVRYMGAYENGNGFRAPFFIAAAEFRAVRYHVMELRTGAPEKGEGKYTLRRLLAHESPAGMFGTPGYYPIRTSGPPPAISLYSEYFCMLAGTLPPYPSYTVKEGSRTRPARWFPDLQLQRDLQILTRPNTPRALQVWAMIAYDAQAQAAVFEHYTPGMKLPESPDRERLSKGKRKEATPSPGAGKPSEATLLGHTPPLTKRTAETEAGGTGRKRARKQPAAETEPVVSSQLIGLASTMGLVGRLSDGGPAALADNATNLVLGLMTQLPTALTGGALAEFIAFAGRVPSVVARCSANPAPSGNLQLIKALCDLTAAAAAVSVDVAKFLQEAVYELLDGRPITGAIALAERDLPPPPGGGGAGSGSDEESEEEDRALRQRGLEQRGPRYEPGVRRREEQGGGSGQGGGPGQAQASLEAFGGSARGSSPSPRRALSRDSRSRERSPSPRRSRSRSFSRDRYTSSSSGGSEPPSPTGERATSARRASLSPTRGATWPAPLYSTPPPAAAATPPSKIAAQPPARWELSPFLPGMYDDEVDYESTPERSLTAADDVIAAEEVAPVGDRLPVRQRLGSVATLPERRPISERLSVPVQEPRVPVTDRLGPPNSRPRVQDRLDFSRAPSLGDAPTVTIGDRLLSLASAEDSRDEPASDQQTDGVLSPTPGLQFGGTPEPDESVQTKRSRFDKRPSIPSAIEAEQRHISAQRLLQKHRLAETAWKSVCNDPNNMCPGRAEDLDCLEGLRFLVAEAEAECAKTKWEADFAKAREHAQAKAAAAAASAPTISFGAGFEQVKKKRPANRRGGKGRKPAQPPSFARRGADCGGSESTPPKRSTTSTSVVTTAAVSASIKTVSRVTRWDK